MNLTVDSAERSREGETSWVLPAHACHNCSKENSSGVYYSTLQVLLFGDEQYRDTIRLQEVVRTHVYRVANGGINQPAVSDLATKQKV